MIRAALVVASLVSPVHDEWANGLEVPSWVKSSCCGRNDIHKLTLAQVWRVRGGWRVNGLDNTVPDQRTFPSQDGFVWGFWWDGAGPGAVVNCLFVPISF